MPPGIPAARGHLRLAMPPAEPARRGSRALLAARAAGAVVTLFLATLLAYVAIAVALAPLLVRRAPLGGRLRPLRAREARVIRLQPRQQALPR